VVCSQVIGNLGRKRSEIDIDLSLYQKTEGSPEPQTPDERASKGTRKILKQGKG